MRPYLAACLAAAVTLATGASPADDTDVPEEVAIASPDDGEEESGSEEKKPRKKPWQAEDAFTKVFFGGVLVSAGSGWITGKAYADDPLTEQAGDGPGVGKGMHDAGTAARWLFGYVTKKGLLLCAYARLGLSRGRSEGIDDEYDAWMLGARVGYLFYSKNQLNIFGFLGAGYGSMRHRVSDVTDPHAEPDPFVRRDIYPFEGRKGVDVWKKSGAFDANFGALVVWHFTPTFNLIFEVAGDFIAPDIAFNIDVAGGLALSFW
jgi:hypothetical protein